MLIAAGALGICLEFIRPGMVIPGVVGCLLVTFGVWSLWHYPLEWRGAALAAGAFTLFGVEARYRLRGVAAAAGAVALMAGIRSLVVEPRIHWLAATAVAIPFSGLTSLLLAIAWRARVNKRTTIF